MPAKVSIHETTMQNLSLIELLKDNNFTDEVLQMIHPYSEKVSSLQLINMLPSVLEGFGQVQDKLPPQGDQKRELLHWYAILFLITFIRG
jgi:hypothetical protein